MHPDAATPAPAEIRDWTFVVRERCPECGFDPAGLRPEDVPDRVRATIEPWTQVLTGADPSPHPDSTPRPGPRRRPLTARPAPEVWSPLEYACHVRDVCGVFGIRLALILSTAGSAPRAAQFADWDQNRTQVEGLYNDADPATAAAEYRAAAEALADAFSLVEGSQWDLEGRRGDGAVFTTRTLAAYLVHDLEHHLVDAG